MKGPGVSRGWERSQLLIFLCFQISCFLLSLAVRKEKMMLGRVHLPTDVTVRFDLSGRQKIIYVHMCVCVSVLIRVSATRVEAIFVM